MVIRGCKEGKLTPRLEEILCPRCGEVVEVFVKMDGKAGQTGTLASDEKCPGCGKILEAGTYLTDYEPA